MRGRVEGGVVRPEQPLPEGTEVEITPIPESGVSFQAELEQHLQALAENGELELPPPGARPHLEPLVDQPVPGAIRQFLEDRR